MKIYNGKTPKIMVPVIIELETHEDLVTLQALLRLAQTYINNPPTIPYVATSHSALQSMLDKIKVKLCNELINIELK